MIQALFIAAVALVAPLTRAHDLKSADDCDVRAVAVSAITAFLINKDETAIDTYISDSYVQHSPYLQDGKAGIVDLIAETINNYEAGNVIVDGNLVGVHGRFDGESDTYIVFDLFRVDPSECLLVEHWDVLQAEVSPTVSGNDMFTAVDGALDV